jgi:hypothetical protein
VIELANKHPTASGWTPDEEGGDEMADRQPTDGTPTYLGGGDPARRFSNYYPTWVDNLADDVTLEGSLQDGAVQGAEVVRTIVGTIRTMYENQEFNFAPLACDRGTPALAGVPPRWARSAATSEWPWRKLSRDFASVRMAESRPINMHG